MGHDPLRLLAPDDRLDGVGAAVCVPAAVASVGVREAVGLTEGTRLVGEPEAEPEEAALEGEEEEEEALETAAEAADGARTAAAGTEGFAGAALVGWDWPEGVGEDVGFCRSASALPLGTASLASSTESSIWE